MKMLPDLLALRPKRSDIGDAPAVLVVSKGSVEANGRLFAGRGAHLAVAIQDEGEVASVYGVNGTPMGCLVDEDGRAASELIAGADELLALAGIAGLRDRQGGGSARRRGAGPRITKSLDGSQLLRDGLKAGALAPDFTLPRIDGSELSLSRYRGRRVLLAFSDPNCGPCDALAPKLEDLHRRSRSSDPQILMISRGDVEANRRKIDELGLTFPIVLQRQWEISKSFGIFATPVGFLVREDGLLASDVAMGVESILHLAEDEAGSELRRAI
jgi:peroxiredoxin